MSKMVQARRHYVRCLRRERKAHRVAWGDRCFANYYKFINAVHPAYWRLRAAVSAHLHKLYPLACVESHDWILAVKSNWPTNEHTFGRAHHVAREQLAKCGLL